MTEERRDVDERIIRDPDVLVGKPIVKGTRIPVELVLKHLARNPDVEALLAAYPRLTLEDVKACLSFAQVRVERVRPFRRQRSPGGAAEARA